MAAADRLRLPGGYRLLRTFWTAITKIKALGNTITFSATAGVVLGFQGIYEVIQPTIYLYIPLLTMNLMSREYASGSIKLLYSSPVSSFQIIGGKFLAMVFIALLFVVILALPLITMAVVIPPCGHPARSGRVALDVSAHTLPTAPSVSSCRR